MGSESPGKSSKGGGKGGRDWLAHRPESVLTPSVWWPQ